MRFAVSAVSAVLAFAASALAQTPDFNPIYTPSEGEVVPAGASFEITWKAPAKYADGTVSVSLIGGESQKTQVPLMDIVAGIPNSQETFTWAVDASLGAEKLYGIVIKLESDPSIYQFSQPFSIAGGASDGESTDTTVLVTTSQGIKTVTLQTTTTSSEPETTSTSICTTSSTPEPTTTSSIESTSTSISTSTSTSTSSTVVISTTVVETETTPAPTTIVTSTTVVAPPPSFTTPGGATVPIPTPGAAAHVGSGSLALAGGLAAALLML